MTNSSKNFFILVIAILITTSSCAKKSMLFSMKQNTPILCTVGGQYNELCVNDNGQPVDSSGPPNAEFDCLKFTTCELQSNGVCDWTQNQDYSNCLNNLNSSKPVPASLPINPIPQTGPIPTPLPNLPNPRPTPIPAPLPISPTSQPTPSPAPLPDLPNPGPTPIPEPLTITPNPQANIPTVVPIVTSTGKDQPLIGLNQQGQSQNYPSSKDQSLSGLGRKTKQQNVNPLPSPIVVPNVTPTVVPIVTSTGKDQPLIGLNQQGQSQNYPSSKYQSSPFQQTASNPYYTQPNYGVGSKAFPLTGINLRSKDHLVSSIPTGNPYFARYKNGIQSKAIPYTGSNLPSKDQSVSAVPIANTPPNYKGNAVYQSYSRYPTTTPYYTSLNNQQPFASQYYSSNQPIKSNHQYPVGGSSTWPSSKYVPYSNQTPSLTSTNQYLTPTTGENYVTQLINLVEANVSKGL